MQTSIVFWCFYFSHHIFIPITTPKINPTENIQLSDAKSWIVFTFPGKFSSVESLTPVLLINSEIRFQWMVIVTIPNFSAPRERINSTARYTRTVYPMWKRIQTMAHPKAAPRIGCLIGWLTKLRGHVIYDQTVDVMLLKSMTRNPYPTGTPPYLKSNPSRTRQVLIAVLAQYDQHDKVLSSPF